MSTDETNASEQPSVTPNDSFSSTPPNDNNDLFAIPSPVTNVGLCTPKHNSMRKKVLENLRKEQTPKSPMLQIPASPAMQRLGYGTGVGVYLLERSPRSTGVRSPWAIKKTITVEETSEIYGQRIEYEAEILRKLSHPNIIGYRGFGKPAPDTTFLAMEKAHRSLADLIEERIEDVMLIQDCDSAAPFPATKMEKVALDVAKALTYLHDEIKMVHGDLKSANVLIFGDFEVMKLCDFGVARKLNDKGYVEGGYVGTEIWNSKEVILYKRGQNNSPITYKADIYPFGLVIYEMITLKPPHLSCAEESILETEKSFETGDDPLEKTFDDISFDELAYEEALARHVGTRPPLPDIDFDSTYNIILGVFYCCTDEDPTKRPDAKDIVSALTDPSS